MKRLIINADDFGWDFDTLEATIALIERGWVTSASIMTGRPASSMAIDYAARSSRRISFGLHFNIVDGHPAMNPAANSLVDDSGRFLPSSRLRIAALLFRLSPADIAQELRAQLMELRRAGVKVSHVDSHGHMHKFPAIAKASVRVLKDFGISRMRRPQDTYRHRSVTDVIDYYCAWRFPKDIKTTDHYYALDHVNTDWFEKLPTVLKAGLTELSVHPGRNEKERRFEIAALDNRDPAELAAMGVTLVSYHDL
jgi:predicted glycoside hydrolase/deacetylase ChbG (UPF0249 family)